MTTTTTRRAILAGIAAAPVAALPAAASTIGPNDRRLIAIWEEWQALRAAAEAIYARPGNNDAESYANLDARDVLEREAICLPADGLPGAIAKMRIMVASWYEERDDKDPGALVIADAYQTDGILDIEDFTFSIVADVARIGGAA